MNSIKQTDMQMCTVYVNLSHNTLTIYIVEKKQKENWFIRDSQNFITCSTTYAAINFSMP